jgi:hypothetical protein
MHVMQADWQMRKQAVETCAVLAAAIQVCSPIVQPQKTHFHETGFTATGLHKVRLVAWAPVSFTTTLPAKLEEKDTMPSQGSTR